MTSTPFGIPRDPKRKLREPIGCAVANGRKVEGRGVVDRDRLFIVLPTADARGMKGRRAFHPQFAAFNALPDPTADEAKRKSHTAVRSTVRGIFVHEHERDAWTENLQAAKLPGHEHPLGAPSCEGNGCEARRWMPRMVNRETGEVGMYDEIVCPGRRCEFQQKGQDRNGKPTRPLCGPFSKLVFQLRMNGMPSLLAKYTSKGWETSESIAGFMAFIREQGAALGIERPSIYGVPFALTVAEKTGEGSRYPVVHISPDFGEGRTLQHHLLGMGADRKQIAADRELLRIGTAATIEDDADAVPDDIAALSVP